MKYLNHPWIFLLLSVIITVIVKIPHLGLPYFMDESFSYVPAIKEMAKVGPNLCPGTIPIYLSKGHPLFFYLLTSLWMKFIAGDSVILMRLFPLFISLFALYVFHLFAKRHTNRLLANVAVVLLSVQPLFLAQASLVLPEVMLFILFILSFDSYLSRDYGLYALYGSLVMLTKETGAVFIMVFGLAYLVENYKTWNSKIFRHNLFLLATPVLVYMVFLIIHHHVFGVFFFDEHLGYITMDSAKVIYKFNSATYSLFLAHGRNLIFFASILSLLVLLFRKKKIEHQRLLIMSLAILIVYLIFTILNFFTYRYIFPVMGISLLASLVLIQQLRIKFQPVNIALIVCMLLVSSYNTATKRGQWDADLGYTEYLVVHQQMVKYCEQQEWYDKEFGAGYNIVMAMRDHLGHYLSTDKDFHMHHLPGIEKRDLIIYDSTVLLNEMPEEEKNKLTLVKHFEYKKHWGDIYSTPLKEMNQTNQ